MRLYTSIMFAGVLLGCSSSTPSGTTPTDSGTDSGGGATTFTTVYTTVIAVNCMPCHTTAGGDGVTGGMLDMTTQAKAYADLVGVMAAGDQCGGKGTRVVAGSPSTSIMFEKISSTPAPCGSSMPLGGPALSAANLALVQSWIQGGALND